ncbi:hypothetical protein AHAS_Ahas13G0246400 [Arachis hypogaea]
MRDRRRNSGGSQEEEEEEEADGEGEEEEQWRITGGREAGRRYSVREYIDKFTIAYTWFQERFVVCSLDASEDIVKVSRYNIVCVDAISYTSGGRDSASRDIRRQTSYDVKESDIVYILCCIWSGTMLIGVIPQVGRVQQQPYKALDIDFLMSKDGRG